MKCTYLVAMVMLVATASDLGAQASRDSVPSTPTVKADSRFLEIREHLVQSVRRGETPSISVAVAQNGKIVWEEAIGWADREHNIAATPSTMYKIGSLSKSIIATGVMALVDKGRLSLNDPVERVIAPAKFTAYDGKASEVTVKHLLNMTAGIPHGSMGYFDWADVPHTAQQIDEYVARVPILVFPAGKVYEYSNFSVGLSDVVIERAAKKPFAEYMRDDVFRPLGMSNSSVWFDDAAVKTAAVPYATITTPFTRRSFLVPPGGLGFLSSAHDIAMFGMFHLKSHRTDQAAIMRDETLDLMHNYDGGPQGKYFALGIFNLGSRLVSDGQVGGGTSNLTMIPATGTAIVVLANITSRGATANAGLIAHDIAELFDPTSPEESRRSRQAFVQKFITPYRATTELNGVWKGKIRTAGGDTPFTLTFGDTTVAAQIGTQPVVLLQGASYNTMHELRGDFTGSIRAMAVDAGAADHTPAPMTIVVRLENGRLSGYVSTTFSTDKGSFALPAFVALQRVGG